ncbi:MAG: class I SAM-dependent methyltransferase [Halovenus sp.]
MKKSLDDHAERFSERAAEYDDSQDSPEYRAAADLVVSHANPDPTDTVLDLGTGTGAIAFGVAETAGRVIGRDISEGMLERAAEKARARDVDTVEFGVGRFREPNVPDGTDVDIVTSNFAMHHLGDAEKREAIEVIADLAPRRIVLGDVMFFGDPDPAEPFYSPEVDDPATVGVLADAVTDSGYALTAVEMVADQVGVLVGERIDQES